MNILRTFLRRQPLGSSVKPQTLKRCLTTLDIALFGIAHMIGAGIYVVTPNVARTKAGPGIVLSYLIAGFASLLAAFCYAHFAVRCPKAGSAYSYAYSSVGELLAVIVGWNVLLESLLGIVATSRSFSAYGDSLLGHELQNLSANEFGTFDSSILSKNLDFGAVLVVFIFAFILSFGTELTSQANNALCVINISVLVVIICYGFYHAKLDNWTNNFLPYNFNGVFSASATCFFAYGGFDVMSVTGEEAINPKKSIPLATMFAMSIVTILYTLASAVITLIVPYYDLKDDTGFPSAFRQVGASWITYLVTVGALCGMSTVVIGNTFGAARIVYAMASDGLLYQLLARVHEKTKIPLWAMYSVVFPSALLALLIDTPVIINLLSIGVLIAYLIVACGVVMLHYDPSLKHFPDSKEIDDKQQITEIETQKFRPMFKFLENRLQKIAGPPLIAICLFCIVLSSIFMGSYANNVHNLRTWYSILLMTIAAIILAISIFLIVVHKETSADDDYKMPLVPYLPILSVIIDALLMSVLEAITWLRLVIWIAIGLILYFTYGISHSSLNSQIMNTSQLEEANNSPQATEQASNL